MRSEPENVRRKERSERGAELRCCDCERWLDAQGVGNRRRCLGTGTMRWRGDSAEECPRARIRTPWGEVAC